LASPTIFGFTGLLAQFTYALGAVHLILTVLTNFGAGLFKVIPFQLHGVIELIVGVALIILGFTLFSDTMTGHIFYVAFGAAVLAVWLFTDYKGEKAA
jgi:hypothetical protein